MERLKRMDNVYAKTGKPDKLRSRKPMKVKFVRKYEPTEEELDF